jgi:talin
LWAKGLVSAAQNVVAGVKQLVISANGVVSGEADQDELVAAAKMVAAATASLCAASRAKAADPFSSTQQALMKAAKMVADATSRLVEVAREVSARKEEEAEELEATNQTASRKGALV